MIGSIALWSHITILQTVPDSPADPELAPLSNPLDYSRDRAPFIKRNARRIRFGLILATAAILGVAYGPRLTRHAAHLYAQSRINSYSAPPDFAVVKAERQPAERYDFPNAARFSLNAQTPKPWQSVIENPPFANFPTVFLGRRQTRLGTERLVHIFISNSYQVMPPSLTSGPVPDRCFCVVVDIYDPATLTTAPKRIQRNIGIGFGIDKANTHTIFTAQPDPADPRSMILRYASTVGSGNVRITLGLDETATLQVLSGPAIWVSTVPINLPP